MKRSQLLCSRVLWRQRHHQGNMTWGTHHLFAALTGPSLTSTLSPRDLPLQLTNMLEELSIWIPPFPLSCPNSLPPFSKPTFCPPQAAMHSWTHCSWVSALKTPWRWPDPCHLQCCQWQTFLSSSYQPLTCNPLSLLQKLPPITAGIPPGTSHPGCSSCCSGHPFPFRQTRT